MLIRREAASAVLCCAVLNVEGTCSCPDGVGMEADVYGFASFEAERAVVSDILAELEAKLLLCAGAEWRWSSGAHLHILPGSCSHRGVGCHLGRITHVHCRGSMLLAT